MSSCALKVIKALALVACVGEGARINKHQLREKSAGDDDGSGCLLPAARAVCEYWGEGQSARKVADTINRGDSSAACEAADVISLCSGLSMKDSEGIQQLVDGLKADTAEARLGTAAAIVKLSRQSISKQHACVYAGAIDLLVPMLNSLEERDQAAGAVRDLAHSKDEYTQINWGIASPLVISPLVDMLRDPASATRRAAVGAIRNLAYYNYKEAKERIALATIDLLVELMEGDHSSGEREEAAGAIRNLAYNSAANRETLAVAIEVLVKVQKAAPKGSGEREQATGALWNLAWNSETNRKSITDAGGELVQ